MTVISKGLFADQEPVFEPLAARMRPRKLDEYIGQEHLLGPDKPLRQALERGQMHSMVLWGPPGVGKTSLARMLAEHIDARFETLSAVLAGVKDIRASVALAEQERGATGRKTILFVDEVHRFNKAQQDAFLPYVEDGTVIFVGATTENPSFELNNALLSRCRVYVLKGLQDAQLEQVIRSALMDDQRGLAALKLSIDEHQVQLLARAANGDARKSLNLLEIASDFARDGVIDQAVVEEVLASDVRRFDKGGDVFYEQISALHKSVRGSSVDGGLYWFARMLDGGCDPLYIARRVVRMASEEVGNADPRALEVALNAWQVQERLGSPEGELAVAQAIAYIASAPKSNAVYKAYKQVMADVKNMPDYEVPVHLRNAPTSLMKDLDYGADYRYAHDEPDAYAAGECYLPEAIAETTWYQAVPRGLEIKIGDKLNSLKEQDAHSDQRRYASKRRS